MMSTCPTCGQELLPDISKQLDLSPSELVLYEIIRRAGPAGIPTKLAVERFYSGTVNGGPAHARNCISVFKHDLNKKLGKIGWEIPNVAGNGARYVLRQSGNEEG